MGFATTNMWVNKALSRYRCWPLMSGPSPSVNLNILRLSAENYILRRCPLPFIEGICWLIRFYSCNRVLTCHERRKETEVLYPWVVSSPFYRGYLLINSIILVESCYTLRVLVVHYSLNFTIYKAASGGVSFDVGSWALVTTAPLGLAQKWSLQKIWIIWFLKYIEIYINQKKH